MNKSSIIHIPLSEYAYGIDEENIVIRLRTAHNDCHKCTLYFGDRSCRQTPVIFTESLMTKVQETKDYDYYESRLYRPYKRLCYYFKIESTDDWTYYYGDCFEKNLVDDRSEYFQFPFNHRADIVNPPKWVMDAVVYNIFPDSFATGRKYISKKTRLEKWQEHLVQGKLGGTIRGIIDNLDYIKDLGFNTIYMNPIFTAGEYHKYDLLDYFHIDPCFGTNNDFAELVDKCHENDMKVIIDGVFNHCGWNFFAFEDVVKRGEKSPYTDWFYGLKYPVVKPKNPDDIPTYDCFGYERMMPKLNLANRETAEYFCSVGKFWVEKYHIDGWRLDVASEVNDDFWRMFRKAVKEANSQVLIIGEVWESANHWLNGDMFDSAMNYDLRKHCMRFFCGKIDAEAFHERIVNMLYRYREQTVYAELNLLDSHDVSRFLSVCNEKKDLYKAAVVLQMMMPGIPSVFYGDEQGISGIVEEEYRSPMNWTNNDFELYNFFKNIIAIRNNNEAARYGQYRVLEAKKGSYFFGFERVVKENNSINVYINLDATEKAIDTGNMKILGSNKYTDGKLQEYGYLILK